MKGQECRGAGSAQQEEDRRGQEKGRVKLEEKRRSVESRRGKRRLSAELV